MSETTAIALVARQEWLDSVADRLASTLRNAYSASPGALAVKDALNGTWLGHPLHPAVTDVPVGAWTVAVALDTYDFVCCRDEPDRLASAAVAVGLAGAVTSAVTGLTDWTDTDGRSRRIGLVHGLMNFAATGLFATSLVMRAKKRVGAGRLTAVIGYALAGISAYLGGALVFERQIGVDHAATAEVPEEFTAVMAESELKDGVPAMVRVGDTRVMLLKRGDAVLALADTCAHQGGPLSEGTIDGDTVVCPWHASRFSVETGEVINGPATYNQPRFEARIRGGQVEVKTP